MSTWKCKFPWVGNATLHLRDCIEGMTDLSLQSAVDVVVTSPPYNIGANYSRYSDNMPRHIYLDWISEWVGPVTKVIAPGGSLFLNVGSIPTDPWIAMDVANQVRQRLVLQNTFHWIKSIAINAESLPDETEDQTFGHYKPINSPRFVNDSHEFVFHFTHDGKVPIDRLALGVPYMDKSNTTRWKDGGSGYHCRGNTWFIPYRTIQNRDKERPHPATFPMELAEMCIKLHGVDRAGLVLDPFMGLGNTALACAKTGVDFVGYEIDEQYFKEAKLRIQNAEGP